MKTKRNRKGVVLFCFVMLIAVFTGAKQVWAASEYQEMFTIAGSLTHKRIRRGASVVIQYGVGK